MPAHAGVLTLPAKTINPAVNRAYFTGLLAFAAVFVGLPLYWWAFPQNLPVGTANGVYANACCGTLELRDGVMSFGKNERIGYVIEYDKVGRYVLPTVFVGVRGGRKIAADKSRSMLKLYLDASPLPAAIKLTNG